MLMWIIGLLFTLTKKQEKLDPKKWSEKNNNLAEKAFDKWMLEKSSASPIVILFPEKENFK